MVSVIIPTYNEEKALPTTLKAHYQDGTYKVTVVDGGSSDRTPDIAWAEPRLRFETAPKGRAVQMNAAARQACGEWQLFLHAAKIFLKRPLKPAPYVIVLFRFNKTRISIRY
jgi:glycosyltransferase involved in cell wall biosynthesis